jgi:SAM-dependent methyltransferase
MIDRQAFYEGRAAFRLRENDRYYQQLLRKYYAFLVPTGMRVLEVGCSLGDLLAAVRPASGMGIDFSPGMIEQARQRHPNFEFHVADAASFSAQQTFDFILLSDLINDLPDVQAVFSALRQAAHSRTRLVINFFNNLWRPVLHLGEKAGIKAPTPLPNWLSSDDVKNLLHLAGWEVIKANPRILWPVQTPLVDRVFNRWLAPIASPLCLTIFIVARPKPRLVEQPHYRCSVIIPVRNEAGNIEAAVKRTPNMGLGTEIIFVEGGSTDNTREELLRVAGLYPRLDIKVVQQRSSGKGGAMREGFAIATGDLLFILDGDLTVQPEELPKFYDVAWSGTADFVNGVRLAYPLEKEAMRFLNMIANKLFGLTFSWLIGQKLKDTLCGTKVFFRSDYELIAKNRRYFGEFDPFGDFDLLFGAAKLNLRLIDLPIHYRARTYGETNIRRWRHGWLLLRMVIFAARRLKFI